MDIKNFTPKKMVGWFDMKQLSNTAVKATHSSIFGSYADKRETIASISEFKIYDYSGKGEVWVDYIADVGDGFDETSDFFRVLIWDPKNPAEMQTSLIMRFDDKIRFHNQFGREVLAKLLRLDKRIDWKDCGQTQVQEEQDVEKFKEAFKSFDFAE